MKVTLKARAKGLNVGQVKKLREERVDSIPVKENNVFKAVKARELGSCEKLKEVQYG